MHKIRISRYILFSYLVVSLSVSSAVCQTLFISDIDDTIKISHILNTADAILNAPRIDNQFDGMAALYKAYQNNDTTAKFSYVSTALNSIMSKSHQLFLKHNHFPSGDLLLRVSLKEHDFKLKSIRHLIKNYSPKLLILIGDNGESDPSVYAQIQSENPQISTHIYIHQLYSIHSKKETGADLRENQLGFVTAVDLAMRFQESQLIDSFGFDSFMQSAGLRIGQQSLRRDSGTIALPRWVDCRDFFGITQLIPTGYIPVIGSTVPGIIANYQNRLYSRCASGPIKF